MNELISYNVFGTVSQPPGVSEYGSPNLFLGNILKFLIAGAGVFALINLVLAGYGFMGAGGDPKKIADAWAKIWQTLIGLALAVGAFVIAAIIGVVLFDDPNALLQLRVWGP